MKLSKNIDLTEFLRAVNSCSGNVYFSSQLGDHLNLKSILSQYAFSAVTGDRKLLFQGDILCDAEGDNEKLRPYLSVEEEN